MLEHHPHRFDVLGRIAPVTARLEVAEVELVLDPGGDAGYRPGDLARDEGLSTARRLVVREDAVGCEEAMRLPIVDRSPVSGHLGHAVRAAWVERRVLVLGRRDRAVHLRRPRLVEARLDTGGPHRLKD